MTPNHFIALAVSAALGIGCGYNADANKRNVSRQDYSTTTTTGAYTWNNELGGGRSDEEEAERHDREERETAERQASAAQAREASGEQRSTDASGATAPNGAPTPMTAEAREAFAQKLRGQISTLDADVDDIRSRASMAGPESRARVEPILKQVAAQRAQLEQARKRLEVSGGDFAQAKDEAQKLVDELKARVHAARDAI